MQVQASAIPKEGCITCGEMPKATTLFKNSSITAKVTCSPAFKQNFKVERSHCFSGSLAKASLINLKPKFGCFHNELFVKILNVLSRIWTLILKTLFETLILVCDINEWRFVKSIQCDYIIWLLKEIRLIFSALNLATWKHLPLTNVEAISVG